MTQKSKEKQTEEGRERIAKVMARAGLCSRREAERWIAQGRVAVNGRVLTTPAVTVGAADEIKVDGKALPPKNAEKLFIYHKPAGLVTSARDEKGRKTVFDDLPEGLPRLISIGRLDMNTEGLLLLTNDGELSRYLELPSTGWKRRYRVRVHGHITQDRLDDLQKGVTVDGVRYGAVEATIERKQGDNIWLSVVLTEGKNREIRKIMEHLGLRVTRLIRVSYGSFQLGNLKKGEIKEVPRKVMYEQIAGYFKKGKK